MTARTPRRKRADDYRPCAACREAVPIIGLNPATLDRVTCPATRCRARVEWTDAHWAGRARMAEARRDAGITLNGLDLEALDRTRLKANA